VLALFGLGQGKELGGQLPRRIDQPGVDPVVADHGEAELAERGAQLAGQFIGTGAERDYRKGRERHACLASAPWLAI